MSRSVLWTGVTRVRPGACRARPTRGPQGGAGIAGRGFRSRRRSAATALGIGLLVLALAACAPAVRVDRTVPHDGTAIAVAPGETVRVEVRLGYGAFRLEPGDLDPLPLPEIVSTPRENVTGSFSLRAVEAPEAWTASLEGVDRIVAPLSDESTGDAGASEADAGRSYALEASFRIHVPAEAANGTYPVELILRARNTGEHTVRLVFEVSRQGATSGRPGRRG